MPKRIPASLIVDHDSNLRFEVVDEGEVSISKIDDEGNIVSESITLYPERVIPILKQLMASDETMAEMIEAIEAVEARKAH